MIRVWNEEIDQIINGAALLSEGRAGYRVALIGPEKFRCLSRLLIPSNRSALIQCLLAAGLPLASIKSEFVAPAALLPERNATWNRVES
jgi:hypothetical protein